MSLFHKAIFKKRKDALPPSDQKVWGLAGDASRMVLVSADGVLIECPVAEIAEHLYNLPRHSRVYVVPKKGRDIAAWVRDSGIFDALIYQEMKAQLCLSGNDVVAVRLFKSVDRTNPYANIIALRNFDPSAPFLDDPIENARSCVIRGLKVAHAIHEQFGVGVSLTPAATAYTAFQRAIDTERAHFRPHRIAIPQLRDAFYGGAVWSSKRAIKNVKMFDMRGAYAWAMRQGVPIGRAAYTTVEEPDMVGFYRVRAFLQSNRPSPFMLRSEPFRGPGQATSRGGGIQTETWCSSLELALCREFGGYYEIIEGWVFPDGVENLFDTFVAKVDQAERNATGIARATAKLLRNSLFGRFGRKPSTQSVVISAEQPTDGEYAPYYRSNGPVAHTWVTEVDDSQSSGVMPHWAAWLTAQVRCRLLRTWVQLVESGAKVFYLDTDCIITDGELETGIEFGDWQLKHRFKVFQVYASKIYAGFDGDSGETVIAHAGIPRSEANRIIEKFHTAHLRITGPP